MKQYTSLWLSKKLYENGCNLDVSKMWIPKYGSQEYILVGVGEFRPGHVSPLPDLPAYDILWDICIKHVDKFFYEEDRYSDVDYKVDEIIYYINGGNHSKLE